MAQGRKTLVPETLFVRCAKAIMRKPEVSSSIFKRRFSKFFGTDVSVCSKRWAMMPREKDGQPCHLLWALPFLKLYESEHVHAKLCDCDKSTFRKWSTIYVEHIAKCRIVCNVFYTNCTIYCPLLFYGDTQKIGLLLTDALRLLMVRTVL